MPTPQETPVSQLERVDLVLQALEREGYLTLSQIISITGIPRSTVHRLLTHMVSRRWLLRVGDCYEIGIRLFELGTIGLRSHWFHRIALPHLWELQRRTQFTVHLAYLDGGDVVYWEKLAHSYAARLPTGIGGHQPAHCTALGKTLLATEPDNYLKRPEFDTLDRKTSHTITTRDQLHNEITRVRDNGIAVDHGETLPHISCIATSVSAGDASTSDGHKTTAAISICGPSEQISYKLHTAVRATATQVSRDAAVNPMIDH